MVWNASCALNYIHTVMKVVIARKYQTKIRELQSFHFGIFLKREYGSLITVMPNFYFLMSVKPA